MAMASTTTRDELLLPYILLLILHLMEYEGGIYLGEYERAVKNVSTSYGK
jgi:hypothetical protein